MQYRDEGRDKGGRVHVALLSPRLSEGNPVKVERRQGSRLVKSNLLHR